MTDPGVGGADRGLLAERVAAAADAWFADPRDVRVYGRLVLAVQEWRDAVPDRAAKSDPRAATDGGMQLAAGHGAEGGLDAGDDAGEVTGEQWASRPERQPQRLEGILGSVAAELRARGIATPPADAPSQDANPAAANVEA